ncbi:MAG: cholesterol oxidase [Actinomycetota bacterium]|jgi:cholesterol oxidase|nr:cholesterol oxidase [Actinomycetota bacterium]
MGEKEELSQVVIIGSGYAGSVAALRLAQAGLDSVVLERGRRWPIVPQGNTFATPAAPDGRVAWLSTTSPFTPVKLDVYAGVLEAFHGNGVSPLAGAGVGGGSLVNTTVMLQPPRKFFEKSFGDSLDYDEMADVWYPRARALVGPGPIPDDVLNSSFYEQARFFFDQTGRAGLSPFRLDMAVDWQTVRDEIAGTKVASAILGDSIWGINSGAKRSVDRTILASAEGTGRVTVQPLTRAVDIQPVKDGYLVSCEQIDEQGNVVARPTFRARYVFLAAGSLGTTRLLVRCKARGSLPKLNKWVGSLWGSGGDHITVRVGLPYDNPTRGGPSSIAFSDFGNPAGPVTMLDFPWPFPPPGGGGDSAALAVTDPPPLGSFSYDASSDTVQLNWPASDSRVVEATKAVKATLDRINAANPGTSTQLVDSTHTSHAMGGAVLGKACHEDGRLVGYENLYVIDSALLPGSVGAVPPALTVTALADRCVSQALEELQDDGSSASEALAGH